MKRIAPLATLALAIASLCIYLAGFGRHFVTYAQTVPPQVIAEAHQRGFLEIIVGTIGIALAAALAGALFTRHKTLSLTSLLVLALALLSGLIFFVIA